MGVRFGRTALVVVIAGLAVAAAGMFWPSSARSESFTSEVNSHIVRAHELRERLRGWSHLYSSELPKNYCETREEAYDLIEKLAFDAKDAAESADPKLAEEATAAADKLAKEQVDEEYSWEEHDEDGSTYFDDPCDEPVGFWEPPFGYSIVQALRGNTQELPAISQWQDIYIGLRASVATGVTAWNFPDGTTGNFDFNGGALGGTVGMNFQNGRWVYGPEVSFLATNAFGSTGACAMVCRTSTPWMATFAGRVGYDNNGILPYLLGGVAVIDQHLQIGGFAGTNDTVIGGEFGAGVELKTNSFFTLKAEVDYIFSKGSCSMPSCPTVSVPLKETMFSLGANIPLNFSSPGR
jgi:outer membrane immunogenic protein